MTNGYSKVKNFPYNYILLIYLKKLCLASLATMSLSSAKHENWNLVHVQDEVYFRIGEFLAVYTC